ncbi:MAG: VOC family protein [Bacteroidia bacterium]
MEVKTIYINLPIKDVQKTKSFWSRLGFCFNPQFSGDKALCLVLNENTSYAMLISEEVFKEYTNKKIADGNTTQVLIAIQVNSREEVDKIVKLAIENGGKKYKESVDLGWMYYDAFEDIDGHQWEVMFADVSQIPK